MREALNELIAVFWTLFASGFKLFSDIPKPSRINPMSFLVLIFGKRAAYSISLPVSHLLFFTISLNISAALSLPPTDLLK